MNPNNKTLLNKIRRCDIQKLLESKGYKYFTNGLYNLNIIGVRATNRKLTNVFDDILIVTYNSNRGSEIVYYNITTEPGYTYMVKTLGNPKGTAILVPNQYRSCWAIGKHNGKYKALVQVKPVQVYRDGNKDDVYDMDPKTIDKGLFGINIHRSNAQALTKKIDMWSAGCQVFDDPVAFTSFMAICEKQKERYGNSFTYTLITEDDLDNYEK